MPKDISNNYLGRLFSVEMLIGLVVFIFSLGGIWNSLNTKVKANTLHDTQIIAKQTEFSGKINAIVLNQTVIQSDLNHITTNQQDFQEEQKAVNMYLKKQGDEIKTLLIQMKMQN